MVAQISDGRLQLGGLFNGLKVDVNAYKDVIDQFKSLDFSQSSFRYTDSTSFNWDAIADSIENCDARVLSYFRSLDDGNGTINAQSASLNGLSQHLQRTGQSYSFAAVKATLLNTAINAVSIAAVSLVIQAVVSGLDHYIHRAERAREAAEQAQQAIDSSQSSLKKAASTLAENRDRFLELSEGVSRFSKNLRLSEEDYAEYLSLSNQFAELFPSLVAGYDEQGNALIRLGEDADDTRQKLQTLLKAQQDSARQTLIKNMDSVAEGTYYDVEEAKSAISSLEKDLESLQSQKKNLNIDLKNTHYSVSIPDEDYEKYGKAMEEALTLAGIGFTQRNLTGERSTAIEIDPSATAGQLEQAQEFYDARMEMENEFTRAKENGLKEDLIKQENIIRSAYSQMTPSLQAWMKDNYLYQYLPDGMAALADALVPETDWSQTDGIFSTGRAYQDYIEQNILTPLMNVPKEDREKISGMMKELLSFEEGDLDILPFAEILQAELNGMDVPIDLSPLIANEKEAKARLTNSIENIAQGFDYYTASGSRVNAKDLNELKEYTSDFDTEQIELWNSVTLGCNNAKEAIEKYQEALKNNPDLNTDPFSISSSISQIAAQLQPQFSKLGEAYRAIFTENGFTPSALNNSMLEELRKSFTESGGMTGVDFDASKLEDFLAVLTDAGSTSDEVQKAFNRLAASYLYGTETLDHLNEKTADAIRKQLEAMGVANADELVSHALAAKLEALTLQEQLLAAETEAAAKETAFSTAEFLKESGASEAAKTSLFQLTAAEKIFGNNTLSAQEKVAELKQLATAYGQTTIAARIANMEKAAQDGHIPIDYDKELAVLEKDINNAINNIQVDFKNFSNTSSAGNAGSAAADAYLDAFEKELKDLQNLKDNGILSEKEYLDRLRILYEHYFKDKAQYAEQYAQYERKYLNGYKSLYESLFSHASSLVGGRISLLQEEKDAAIEALEAQKKAAEESYETQIRLLEDKKAAIQDEIDRIREANEDRKEALSLQEKEQALARAEAQRTLLRYSEDRGFYYDTDTEAIQEARKELDDARADAEIRALEKQQDALDSQIDSLKEMADAASEYWDTQKEQTEEYYDALIGRMEEYKSRWEELAGLQEQARMAALAKELGYSGEDLINESSGALEHLKLTYLGILKDLNARNPDFLDSLSRLAGQDLGHIPGFLEGTRQAMEGLAQTDTSALAGGLQDIGKNLSSVASSAGDAAAAISGDGVAGTPGEPAQADGGAGQTAGTKTGPKGKVSLKAAIRDLSTQSVEGIAKISGAFAGEDGKGASVTGAIQKVTDKLGNADPENAEPDSLMAVQKEQAREALDEEHGIPAQEQAWESLNGPLEKAAAAVTALQEALEDMDGREYTVTIHTLGDGGALVDTVLGSYSTQDQSGRPLTGSPAAVSGSSGNRSRHGGSGNHDGRDGSFTADAEPAPESKAAGFPDTVRPLPPQYIPYPPENDHSRSAEMYRTFRAAIEDSGKMTDFLAAAPKINPASQFTGFNGKANYNNINTSSSLQQTVTQNITLNCPNVTNHSGIEYIQKQLGDLSLRALQESMRR